MRKKLQIIGKIINTFKDDSGVLKHPEVSFQSPGIKYNYLQHHFGANSLILYPGMKPYLMRLLRAKGFAMECVSIR